MNAPANTPGPPGPPRTPGPSGTPGTPGPAAPAAPAGPASPPGPRHGAPPPPKRKGAGGKILTTVLVLGLAGGGTYAYRVYADRPPEMPGVNEVTSTAAQQQSTLVDQEDLRVMQTRAQQESDIAGGGAAAVQARQPRLMSSANGRTLMLPQRREPYYVSELQKLAGEDFQQLGDGSYLLNVSIMVAAGGKLVLQSSTGPLTIRMRSVPGSFASIVSAGGSVRINGSAQNPVNITSWNEETRSPDTKVSDGRAYVRAIGGSFSMTYTNVKHLGFWSGRTGGVSLTGSDRPDSSAEQVQPGPPHQVRMPDGSREQTRGNQDQIEVRAADGSGGATSFHVPQASLVSGTIENSTFDGNAYGIFVTASNQTRLAGNTISNSLVNGVLLHRFAKNATIENTTVSRSRGDGFVLSRGTEGVRITNCTSKDNGGNGYTLNGQPLAEGPSASGEGTTAFGQNLISGSNAEENERYGFEILGGDNVAIQNSRVTGGDMGIVAREMATRVQISGNQIRGPERQGVVLRDGVEGGSVAGNVIHGTQTALYVRDSSVTLQGNTVQSASRHGVTLNGDVGATVIAGNTISGSGSSALDYDRAQGQYKNTGNNIKGWNKTAGFWTWVKRVLKPMNVIWAGVFLLVAVSAFRSRGTGLRIGRRGAHPYEQQTKLEERPVRLLRRTPPAAPPNGQRRQPAGTRVDH